MPNNCQLHFCFILLSEYVCMYMLPWMLLFFCHWTGRACFFLAHVFNNINLCRPHNFGASSSHRPHHLHFVADVVFVGKPPNRRRLRV